MGSPSETGLNKKRGFCGGARLS